MLARTHRLSAHQRRRGVVLVLILAMLGLLALIGVTFATFSGQAQVGARNYSERMNEPDPERVFDFALAQLIYDTDNPASALHGHSLVRDMYGNDSHNHGLLSYLPTSGLQLSITAVVQNVAAGTQTISTNIPSGGHPSLYGANFARWTMRLDPILNTSTGVYYCAQTFEVLIDTIDSSGYHVFTVPLARTAALANDNLLYLRQPDLAVTFTLDGRYQRAFNGPGLSPISIPIGGYNYTAAMFGNFLFGQAAVSLAGSSARFSPDIIGMDEDYDAVDAENWYLAAQNADVSINIPSFHRPGLLTANDWVNSSTDTALDRAIKRAKILRPRAADHPAAGQSTFPDLVPDSTGKIKYDVDNDGDGITDAVWLDLGYPPQRDTSGKLYKPLFAITVVGLNGRLPLNTVGNLSGRQNYNTKTAPLPLVSDPARVINDVGAPTLDHVSGHGYTPSEINPKYAFNGSDTSNGLLQLQKLLQGTVTGNTHVDGRWGEGEQLAIANGTTIPFPRPGRSANLGGSDDNFDGLDFMPHPSLGLNPESSNLTDATGSFLLPSERTRFGVVPIDTTGNGFLVDWTNVPSTLNRTNALYAYNFGAGFDKWGRVGYYMYSRPPGRPPAGFRTNVLHSWESHRYPVDSEDPVTHAVRFTREFWGAMPFNNGGGTGMGDGSAGYTIPTFTILTSGTDTHAQYPVEINAQNPPQATNPNGVIDATNTYGLLPGSIVGTGATAYASQNGAGTLMRDDPTEVNLYQPNQLDELFSYPDLEWLYRKQDVDGSSLQSRLADLLPDAFISPADGLARQRSLQFSLESWDTNDFAWSTDNPGNAFPNNATFTQNQNASYRALGLLTSSTPSLAARGRKINLNMPLPISTNPFEPTRLKWINNAYQTFKAVLPPKSKDTPEELAAIGQYCVNIIDFRDPDDSITIWTNPDVVQGRATATTYSKLYAPSLGSLYTVPASTTTDPLIHYGMEYQPVAINEALAYSVQRNKTPGGTTGTAIASRRLFLELVNMNTEDRGLANNGTRADLGLTGWEIVVLPDNSAMNRPDPITGQVTAAVEATPLKQFTAAGTPFQRACLTARVAGVPQPLPNLVDAMDERGPRGTSAYYVLGYPPITAAEEVGPPGYDGTLEGTADDLLPTVTGQGQYIWVYLRRPADPTNPTSKPVVVDSIRIPMSEAGGTYTGAKDMSGKYITTTGAQVIYSTERLQPYRGGQAVPENQIGTGPTAITNALVPRYAYGYSEQTKPSLTVSTLVNWFNSNTTSTLKLTGPINHTLGRSNTSNPGAGDDIDLNWSPFIFHDRDFASVAELLLVPGSPPGLFTKQFVERGGTLYPANPTDPNGATFPYTVPPAQIPKNTLAAGFDYRTAPAGFLSTMQYVGLPLNPSLNPTPFNPMPASIELPVYPYLPDNFYYTGASLSFTDTTAIDLNGTNTATGDPIRDIGGQNGAGWHRALEFFEVPSPMIGAIGSVADGENRDWLRKDLRPGQLNLNLIFDESVYKGLVDDPRLDTSITPGIPYNFYPRVVSQVNANGYPTAWTSLSGISGSFSDFLKLRHGGSGFMFAFGGGASGYGAAVNDPPLATDPAVQSQPVAVERPFRSLSYPDIKYTILRPATLEPVYNPVPATPPASLTSPLAQTPPTHAQLKDDANPFGYAAASYWGDPGLKNPFFSRYLQDTDPVYSFRSQYAQTQAEKTAMVPAVRPTSVVQPPPIPPRRMFELADYVQPGAVPIPPENAGNASESGDSRMNTLTTSQSLSIVNMDLFQPDGAGSVKLGILPSDLRRHPLYRTELLQKMMNLTTVRTHQYAVWVTVGFFEVAQPGNPQLATISPADAIDQLGPEVGLAHGTNVRYRSFFVIDRTRATGFDPADPGDFRSLILHRRRIE